MKRDLFASLALATVLSFSCVGCSAGSPASAPAETGEVASEESTETQEPEESSEGQQESLQASNSEEGSGTYVGDVPDQPQPFIKEACWWTTQDQVATYIHVVALMGNTDPTNCYVFPKINAVAYAEDGTVLGTQAINNQFIAPSDVMPGYTLITTADKPAKVEFEISFDPGTPPGNPYTLANFSIENTSEQQVDEFTTRWTGQFTNGCGVDFPSGCNAFVLLRRGGQLVGGYQTSSFDEVTNGSTHAFSVDAAYVGEVPEHDAFEVYIVPNLI